MRKKQNLCTEFRKNPKTRRLQMKQEMNYAHVAKRKIGLLLLMLASALWIQADEYAYPYLIFTNSEGNLTAFQVNNLTMHVNGAQLDVTNDEGTVHFTLTDLSAMQFSVDSETLSSGLENVLNADARIEVYTLEGISLGTFDGLLKAASSLKQGAYVITDGKNTQKIVIR